MYLSVVVLLASAIAGPLGPFLDDSGAETRLSAVPDRPDCDVGGLVGGVAFPLDDDLYDVADPGRSWGTPLLVSTLVNGIAGLYTELPDADPVFVGDLSHRWGGPMPPHRYHRRGRDADIGLFTIGGLQPAHGFEDVAPSELDVEATWILIRNFLDTGAVESILLDRRLILEIMRWLEETEQLTPEQLLRIFPVPGTERAWAEPGIVRHAARHRNHMHVRVLCE